jgi:cholesterol oxidase
MGDQTTFDADFLILGSGFGGSASALRLVDKGYDVVMLERGRELGADDFPKTNWNVKRWLWMPKLGWRGLFVMRFFRHATVLAGSGVGGGSLVYANTLPIPGRTFFEFPSWSGLANWEDELRPHYATARKMMGATEVPFTTRPDELLRQVAIDRGQPEAFKNTVNAVYFGKPGVTVPDPYFDGEGPDRTGCNTCGACMTGCRHDAKNSLDKNYLYLARKRGLRLHADTEVTHVRPLPDGEGYEVTARHGARLFGRSKQVYRVRNVVFSGGVLGTVDLLLELKDDPDGLPALSDQLGRRIRTNSESLMSVSAPATKQDLSRGVAIGSIYEIDETAHLEVVRYGKGSGFFRMFTYPHSGRRPGPVRVLSGIAGMLRRPLAAIRTYGMRGWAGKTIILLYMKTTKGTLTFRRKRGLAHPFKPAMGAVLEDGEAPSCVLPEATVLGEEIAAKTGGLLGSWITEAFADIPTTAHILGGCSMGEDANSGVIDHRHEVFGYPGLYVIDGSAISANPGVNPSLTILALAERAMSFIPKKAALRDRTAAE